MLWIKLSCDMATDDKIANISPLAELLYIRILCFSKSHMQDGFISHTQLPYASIKISNVTRYVKELTANQLLQEVDNGYAVPFETWKKWNYTSEDIENIRSKWRERQQKHRSKSKGCHADVTRDSRDSHARVTQQEREIEREIESEEERIDKDTESLSIPDSSKMDSFNLKKCKEDYNSETLLKEKEREGTIREREIEIVPSVIPSEECMEKAHILGDRIGSVEGKERTSVFSSKQTGELFEELWVSYPRRNGNEGKAEALQVFTGLIQFGTHNPQEIIEGAKRYKDWAAYNEKIGTEFIKMLCSWLRKQRWTDDYTHTKEISWTAYRKMNNLD